MTPFLRLANVVSSILDSFDDKLAGQPLSKDQPPVFIRTVWLFGEIDEAVERQSLLVHQLKVARANGDRAGTRRLTQDLIRRARQTAEMARWADEQFQRDADNV